MFCTPPDTQLYSLLSRVYCTPLYPVCLYQPQMMLHHSHTKENEILITIITLEKDWFRVTRLIISQPFNHAKNKCCLIITYYIVPLKQLPGGIILQTVGEGEVTVVDGVSFVATDVGISLGESEAAC